MYQHLEDRPVLLLYAHINTAHREDTCLRSRGQRNKGKKVHSTEFKKQFLKELIVVK
jgi:hypothetical protein